MKFLKEQFGRKYEMHMNEMQMLKSKIWDITCIIHHNVSTLELIQIHRGNFFHYIVTPQHIAKIEINLICIMLQN
jgi:hypothetical protein